MLLCEPIDSNPVPSQALRLLQAKIVFACWMAKREPDLCFPSPRLGRHVVIDHTAVVGHRLNSPAVVSAFLITPSMSNAGGAFVSVFRSGFRISPSSVVAAFTLTSLWGGAVESGVTSISADTLCSSGAVAMPKNFAMWYDDEIPT